MIHDSNSESCGVAALVFCGVPLWLCASVNALCSLVEVKGVGQHEKKKEDREDRHGCLKSVDRWPIRFGSGLT